MKQAFVTKTKQGCLPLRGEAARGVIKVIASFVLLLPFFIAGCSPAIPEISGTAYFVDCEKGEDANPGRSASKAWRSVEQINATAFQPGDGIFFKRGTTCNGALTPQGSGRAGHPILIGAYGHGQLPIIDAENHPEAVKLVGQEYWEIQDIEITGSTKFGVLVSGTGGIEELHHIHLTNLLVHDVWGAPFEDKTTGLVVVLANSSIFHDVLIDGITASDTNQWAGIEVNGGPWPIDFDNPWLSEDIIIRNSTVSNVYGDGIVLWGVKNGLIEYSVAYNTGQQPSPQTVGTPSSIWTWSCIDCVVQFNESYNAKSPEVDAGCYDIDWGTRNNIYQYNYGHDCDGYCISVFGAGGTTTENAVIRYNVCANNGRRPALASREGNFFLSTWGGGDLDGVLIHNNTAYWSPEGNHPALVNKADFTGERPNIFANNLIVSAVPWLVDGNQNLQLDHNLYWLTGEGDPFFFFGEAYYKGFTDYQEFSGFGENSIYADPKLTEFTDHETGLPEEAFRLQADSPAIDAGTDLGSMGVRDFFGNAIPYGTAYDIGAHEWTPKVSGSTFPPGLAASLRDLQPGINESELLLVGLVNPQDEASRSQVVFLRSIARQFAAQGLRVLLLDVSGLSETERANLSQNWHLETIPIQSKPFDISTPATFLWQRGRLQAFWRGLALPFDLAFELQKTGVGRQ